MWTPSLGSCAAAFCIRSYAHQGYDAIHLAAALEVADADLVVVAGDHALLGAAAAMGLAIAPASGP